MLIFFKTIKHRFHYLQHKLNIPSTLTLWQKIIAIFSAKKINQKHKKLTEKIPNPQEISQKISPQERSLEVISQLLKKYEEFVKEDLYLLVLQVNTYLSDLKQKITNHSTYKLKEISSDLTEITEVYHHSQTMINQCMDNCYNYQQKIIEIQPSSKHRLIQSQLNHVVKQLQKSHRMIDLDHNQDYKFVNRYLEEHQQKEHSRN